MGARSDALLTSMHLIVLQERSFSVPMAPLLNNCHLFQENRILLIQPNYDVQSRVSVDLFRTFVGAIGGTEPDITGNNASDLGISPTSSSPLHSRRQWLIGGRCIPHRTQARG
jgi:hypothetical protein